MKYAMIIYFYPASFKLCFKVGSHNAVCIMQFFCTIVLKPIQRDNLRISEFETSCVQLIKQEAEIPERPKASGAEAQNSGTLAWPGFQYEVRIIDRIL